MPKITEKKQQPFVAIEDPNEVRTDPLLVRVLGLFDSLRRRNVGPERAAYCVSQVFGNSANGGAYPASNPIVQRGNSQ